MRIYLSGNEDTCKWHLPVIESMLHNWVSLCRREGLKQNTFHHIFEDTGTEVHAQYIFGQTSVQVYSPRKKAEQTKNQEESKVDLSCPRTFFIETTQGFFWVIVRRDEDGKPVVTLEKFQAVTGDILQQEYIYPAMGQQTAGIVAGVVDEQRFIVTQKAGVFAGKCKRKGSLVLPAATEDGRITVVDVASVEKRYVVVSGNFESRRVSDIVVFPDTTETGVGVELRYAEVNVLLDTNAGILNSDLLTPNPCWVHRKCTGSYFSPQKTIGFHVDIGTDDDRLGNVDAVQSGAQDKLEPAFNHTEDLYRFCDLLNFPVLVVGDKIVVAVVSATMGYSLIAPATIPWGGYGWDYGAGCADYRQDFPLWMLAPRIVFAEIDVTTGEISYLENSQISTAVQTWDGKFSGFLTHDSEYAAGTSRLYSQDSEEVSDCSWEESVVGRCDSEDDTGYTGAIVKQRTIHRMLVDYGREDISNRRLSYLLFGQGAPPRNTADVIGFYHLFEGLWHLDVGVMWSVAVNAGAHCTLCSYPIASQAPGENIWFVVRGNEEDIAERGHEYVENLEIVTPLGYHVVGSTEVLSFEAKVPENLAAPHEPEVLVGGVEYSSSEVNGELVRCERALMSTPCVCEGNDLAWDVTTTLTMGGGYLDVVGGCPPFNWRIEGGVFTDAYGKQLGHTLRKSKLTSVYASVTDDCEVNVSVSDVCGTRLTLSAGAGIVGAISGLSELVSGESSVYTHNLGSSAEYTGELELVEWYPSGALLRMPDNSDGVYTVRWDGPCGANASMQVTGLPICMNIPEYGCGNPAAGYIFRAGTNCYRTTTMNRYAYSWTDYSQILSWCPSALPGGPAWTGAFVCYPNYCQGDYCNYYVVVYNYEAL